MQKIMLIIIFLVIIFPNNAQMISTSVNQDEYKLLENNTKELKIRSQSSWLDAIEMWSDLMLRDGDWIYSGESNRVYWYDARSASKHTTTSSLFVTHVLQRFGVLENNQRFWSDSNHQIQTIGDTDERLKKIFESHVFTNGVYVSEANIKPGDIVVLDNSLSIYKGLDENIPHNQQWYEASMDLTNTKTSGGRFISFTKTENKNEKIYRILRLRYSQTISLDTSIDTGMGSSTEEDSSTLVPNDNNNSTTSSNNEEEPDSSTSSEEDSGSTSDPYPNGFMENPNETTNFSCETIFLNADGSEKELKKILDNVFTLIKIGAPAVTIILTIIDYIKAIASSNSSDLKKVNSKTIKRFIITVLIILLPFILDLMFNIFGLYDLSRCNIGG